MPNGPLASWPRSVHPKGRNPTMRLISPARGGPPWFRTRQVATAAAVASAVVALIPVRNIPPYRVDTKQRLAVTVVLRITGLLAGFGPGFTVTETN